MNGAVPQRCRWNEIIGQDLAIAGADGGLEVDCAGLDRIDTTTVRALLAFDTGICIRFVQLVPSLATCLAVMAGSRDWRFTCPLSWAKTPFVVRPGVTDVDGDWCIHLAGEAEWSHWSKDQESVAWVHHLQASRICIDMIEVGPLRSVVIGWLLSLRQECPDIPIHLVNPDARALAVLQQMRLGAVFTIGVDDDLAASGCCPAPPAG